MSEKKKGWNSGALTALIALPILYILSIGPLLSLSWYGRLPFWLYEPLNVFHTPVFLLWEHTPLEGPLQAYIEWWIELIG